MSIRIGVSCVTIRDGNPTKECLVAEIRQVVEDPQDKFWQDVSYCLENNIYIIINFDMWGSNGHLDYTELAWRQRVDGVVYQMLQKEPTAKKWRITIENEPMKYWSKEKYAWFINIAYDQIKIARGWTHVQIGAGNEEFSLADKFGMYEYILKNCKFDYLDIHIQAAVIDASTMRVNDTRLNNWCSLAQRWAMDYKKKLSCTEGNWCDVSKETGYIDLIKMLNKAEAIGCEDFCVVFTDYRSEKYTWLTFLHRGEDRSNGNWAKFKQEIINHKPQEEPVGDRIIRLTTPAMEGTDVKAIEDKLKILGFDIKVNSRYENDDYQAMRVFQRETKIVIDGAVGNQTKGKLNEATAENFYPEVFKNIYEKKNYAVELIDYFLSEYAHPNLLNQGKYFKQAEEETGIPVEHQLANGMQESGEVDVSGRVLLGNSYYGRNWKNLYGWAITDSGALPAGKFGTYKDCILTVAHKIKDLFLNPANWRYNGDTIYGIEIAYSTAPYNAINKAKWYRFICQFLDKGIRYRIPEYIDELVPLLEKYFVRKEV